VHHIGIRNAVMYTSSLEIAHCCFFAQTNSYVGFSGLGLPGGEG